MRRKAVIKNKKGFFLELLIVFVITAVMFLFSMGLRSERFGVMSLEHHHHLTGSTIVFTENWFREGAANLGFKMYHTVRSVETPTNESMMLYDSYPPGTILPVYLICKLTNTPPNATIVMGYGLFTHFCVALFLALSVFLLLRRIKFNRWVCVILSLLVSMAEIFFVAPMYFFQNVFFSDQAVLLYFALLLMLEVMRSYQMPGWAEKTAKVVYAITLFMGVLTDWLFVFVFAAFYIKRMVTGELGSKFVTWLVNSIKYAVPAIVALGIYLIQIVTNNSDRFFQKFLERTGSSAESKGWTEHFDKMFWNQYIPNGYGSLGMILLWVSLCVIIIGMLYLLTRKLMKKDLNESIKALLSYGALVAFPCFVQVYFFKNHSAIHDFSTLKMSLVLATIPAVIIPALIIKLFSAEKVRFVSLTMSVVLFAGSGFYLFKSFNKLQEMYPELTPYINEYGDFVRENTEYQDVVFSNDYDIRFDQHSKLFASMKIIYAANTRDDIVSLISRKRIKEDYTINFFDANESNNGELKKYLDKAYEVREKGNLKLYKIHPKDIIGVSE